MIDRDYALTKRRLIKRIEKVIRHHAQLVRDIRWWNEHRTDAPPFDAGGDLAVIALAKQMLAYVRADRRIPEDLWVRFEEQWRANAKA